MEFQNHFHGRANGDNDLDLELFVVSRTLLEGEYGSNAFKIPVQAIISDDAFLIESISEKGTLSTGSNKAVSLFQ